MPSAYNGFRRHPHLEREYATRSLAAYDPANARLTAPLPPPPGDFDSCCELDCGCIVAFTEGDWDSDFSDLTKCNTNHNWREAVILAAAF